MQNMMTPEMMKNASNMFSGMSDAQIQLYLNQMGMTGISPQMFRNMTLDEVTDYLTSKEIKFDKVEFV